MPRCAPGSRRCPPRIGKCHRTGKSGKTAKKLPKLKKPVKNTDELDSSKQKRTWIEHLKWCSKHFDMVNFSFLVNLTNTNKTKI